MSSFLRKVDEAVHNSFIGKFFEFEERKAKFSIEVQGALATFMSMAYILAVNPSILADSGGPCKSNDPFGDPAYAECVESVKRELITSTAIACCVASVLMGLLANLPIALAPGMGINAYFTYSVVGKFGSKSISWETALTAVMIEGIIFLALAVSGARYALVKLIPEPVRLATPAAIGAFLAHIGLQTAEGLGIVVADPATLVTVGACPLSKRVPMVVYNEACEVDGRCIPGGAYTCDGDSGVMTSGTAWVGMLGTVIIILLLTYRVRSAFVMGIGFVTFISWFRDTTITYFPDDDIGDARFDYFKQVVSIEKFDKVVWPFTNDLSGVGIALFTFLYVDFLDTSGTLMGLVHSMGLLNKEDGSFPRARLAFSADALATMFGSIFGLSPVTSYIESGAGCEVGARTGLTAVLVGLMFLLSIFFAPIIASIPPWATGGALIVVGALMARSLAKVKWYDPAHAATAFVTVMVMPLTYSIAYGLIAGLGTWVLVQGTIVLLSLVGIPKPVFSSHPEEGGEEQERSEDEPGEEVSEKVLEDDLSSEEGTEEHHHHHHLEDDKGDSAVDEETPEEHALD